MYDIKSEMQTFYQEVASKRKGGGWRAVGDRIGKTGAYARQLARGDKPITEEIAVAWMLSTGKSRAVLVPTCPDCGSVHHARCNGSGGHAVVLAPGETVRRPAPKRQRRAYWRPCLPAGLTPQQRAQVLELAAMLTKGRA